MIGCTKSCENGIDMIVLPNIIIWHQSPKIIDRSEISTTPRASNRQHMAKLGNYATKQLNIYKKIHFFCIVEARGVAEISDRSTIFGV